MNGVGVVRVRGRVEADLRLPGRWASAVEGSLAPPELLVHFTSVESEEFWVEPGRRRPLSREKDVKGIVNWLDRVGVFEVGLVRPRSSVVLPRTFKGAPSQSQVRKMVDGRGKQQMHPGLKSKPEGAHALLVDLTVRAGARCFLANVRRKLIEREPVGGDSILLVVEQTEPLDVGADPPKVRQDCGAGPSEKRAYLGILDERRLLGRRTRLVVHYGGEDVHWERKGLGRRSELRIWIWAGRARGDR